MLAMTLLADHPKEAALGLGPPGKYRGPLTSRLARLASPGKYRGPPAKPAEGRRAA